MAEKQITDMPVKAAPNSRTTKDSERFVLLAVNAIFDGSAAVTDWLPCVEVVSDSGAVVARHVTDDTVAAGGSAEVTFAPFLRKKASSTSGAGWQFDTDNVGGWGMLETVGEPTQDFSQPNSLAFGDTAEQFSLAVNSSEGTVFANDPTFGLPVVTVEAGVPANQEAQAVNVVVDTTAGSGQGTGIRGDINSGSGIVRGVSFGVSSNTGSVIGISANAQQISGAGTAPTVGVTGFAAAHGAGDAIGLKGQAHAFGAGAACALRCVDHTGAPIFEVRDDGSVHILTGTAVIADL